MRYTRMQKKSGFTLVELLIVVSILAILTLMGVVNYQAAAARSKTARVQADMRTIAGALEAYRVDARAYPPAAIGDLQLVLPLSVLTSPVAYLAALPVDPFGEAPFDFSEGIFAIGYQYKDRVTTSVNMPGEVYGYIWEELPNKEYFLHSCGPNRIWDVTPYIDYDPSNGTSSRGDITRFGPM